MLVDVVHEAMQRYSAILGWVQRLLPAPIVSSFVDGDRILFSFDSEPSQHWENARVRKNLEESDPATCFAALWWLNRIYDTRDETSWYICDCLWGSLLNKTERIPLYMQRDQHLIGHFRLRDVELPDGVLRKIEKDTMVLGIGPSAWIQSTMIDFLIRRAT